MSAPDPREAIARAKAADPGNTFVASCERFFAANGFLSARQVASLGRVTPTRRRRGNKYVNRFNAVQWDSDYYSRDGHGLSQSWDWAGGE